MGAVTKWLGVIGTICFSATAFAQKAPPGEVGVSAPEPAFLVLAAASIIPLWLLHKD